MKILYYSPHPDLSLHSPSGYGTHMREMIKAFREAGHEVTPLIMGDRHGAPAAAPAGPRWRDRVKPLVPAYVWESVKDAALLRLDQRFERELDQVLQEIQPDLVYERAAYLQTSGVRAARRRNIPHILEMNSPYLEENRVLRGTDSAFLRRAHAIEREQLSETTCTAVVSAGLAEYFTHTHGIPQDRIVCTPNGIDPERVHADPARMAALRKEMGLDDTLVVGFVGSIIAWQRVDLLIEAFGQLTEVHPDMRLLIVGHSALAESLKKRCEAMGLAGKVLWPGRVAPDDVYAYIGVMDIAVLPDNLWYGSPTKIFEYGALGKAIIAPNNRTLSQLIEDGQEGMLVSPDARSIASALETLAHHPERRRRMAEAFRAKVFSGFTWRHNVDRVLETLAETVA